MREIFFDKKKAQIFFSNYGKVALLGLTVTITIFVIFLLVHVLTPKKLEVSFLDVGQGDAIFIKTPSGHDVLIDGGATDKVLESLSRKMGYFDATLDMIIATHPDADHVTGLIPVLFRYDVGTVVVSPVQKDTEIFAEVMKSVSNEKATLLIGKEGDEIIFGDGVTLHVLHPRMNFRANEKDANDASVSVLVTYKDESILLTGDLPSTYEGSLIKDILPRHVTIYKAGHHGSKYSSGDKLLSYILPEYSVISAGKDNRYGHPHQETIGRLEKYSQEVISTVDRGTITFLLDGHNVQTMTDK